MSIAFEKAKKTFLGFLTARGKTQNTIKNYSCDLKTLGDFCENSHFDFQNLSLAALDQYHSYLQSEGLKPNSRRRKLMTAKTFLRYLSGRMDVATIGSEKLIPPEKVEQPPKLVSRDLLLKIIREQPETDLGYRNKSLISVLLETGMLVSEALSLRNDDLNVNLVGRFATLHINGKRSRTVKISLQTAQYLNETFHLLSTRIKNPKYFFHGYSRSGPNPQKMTSRGVELLFKGWAEHYEEPHLHPRTLRHLFVMDMLTQGKTEKEIMEMIALKTPYAFKIYDLLLEKRKATPTNPTTPSKSL